MDGRFICIYIWLREQTLSIFLQVLFMAACNPNPTELRHEHELYRLEGYSSYKCNGCKEYGGNVVYKCRFQGSSSCQKFALHEACATVPNVFQHPKHGPFEFHPKTTLRHHCDACGDVMKGFVFETERHHLRKEFRLHPVCMLLPPKLQYSGHANHTLTMIDVEEDAFTCNACNKCNDSGGWRYRCEKRGCRFNVDLSCAKIDIYGLSVARIAPISRSRKVMSKLSKPAKFIAKALFGVGLQVATGGIANEVDGRGNDDDNDRRSNNTNTNNDHDNDRSKYMSDEDGYAHSS